MTRAPETPIDQTRELAALVDTLLPGNPDFPAASAVGVQWPLAQRWHATRQSPSLDEVMHLISDLGGPLAPLDECRRIEVMKRLEHEHAGVFATLRRIAYLSYYEVPAVIAAVAARGHDYRAAPQPLGYPLRPFAEKNDAPRHKRGGYLATSNIRRVETEGMTHLVPSVRNP